MSAHEIISKTGRAIKVPNRAVWHLDKETLGKVNLQLARLAHVRK